MPKPATVHPLPLALAEGNGERWNGLLEVFREFHRWSVAYTPASTVKQAFFDRPLDGLCGLHRTYPPHRHLLLQRGLAACLPGWRETLRVGFGNEGRDEAPLTAIVLPSGPDRWEAAVDDAHLGYEGPAGERLMVRVSLEEPTPGQTQSSFTLLAPREEAAFLAELLERIEAWMAAHPHLRGAKLDAHMQFLRPGRPYTWADIVLDPATRAAVERAVGQFFARLPRYAEFGLPQKRGILLVGPPGTGKTLLGKVLCATLPTTFLWVSPGEVACVEHLQHLFAMARELQPTILFLEDLDLYASRRGGGGEVLLGELLNQLDGFPNNAGVLTLASTNDPGAIEPALADRPSRFDQTICLDLPKARERAELLARFLRQVPHPTDCLPALAAASDGYSGAHLQELVQRAVQAALEAQPPEATDPPQVTAEHLREALTAVQKQRPGRAGFYL